jgi:hypothetical protein
VKRRKERASALAFDGLEQRLRAYGLAASAAGVGLLALAQPAAAEVVYTPAHTRLTKGMLFLDIDNDGNNDFALVRNVVFTHGTFTGLNFKQNLALKMYHGEVIVEKGEAGALAEGATIGSQRNFRHAAPPGELMAAAAGSFGTCFSYNLSAFSGNWANVGPAFLGLSFQINGETHYGWARVGVAWRQSLDGITTTLNGYAYETVAGQSIFAGQRSGTAEDPVFVADSESDGSLGTLARGAVR